MEFRDLLREASGLPPGSLGRSGAAFLLEDGRLRHETGKFQLDATRSVPVDGTSEAELVTADLARRRVFPIEQRDRRSTVKGVSVGRDASNDVRIPASSVSHRHARFERLERGRWALSDERSRNGTFIDATRLRPGDSSLIRPGQVVRLGPEVRLTFLDGDMMEHMLRQLAPVMDKVLDAPRPKRTVAGVPVPDYLDEEDEESLRAPTAARPRAGLAALLEGHRTPEGPPVLAPNALGVTPVPEPPLAVVCDPFAPVGLITGVPITVGRIPGNDLILPHPNVSRRHARFERAGSRVVVVDLGSSNGTVVGTSSVPRAELAPGATVLIGPYELQLLAVTAPRPGLGGGPETSTRVLKP